MNILLKRALEATYNRAINDSTPYHRFWSTFAAVVGTQTKYRRDPEVQDPNLRVQPRPQRDTKLYNWIEQYLFFPLRLPKNILKLGTEFIWNLGYQACSSLANHLKAAGQQAANRRSRVKSALCYGAGYLFQGLGYLSGGIWKLGQSITSPFAALKQTYNFVVEKSRDRWGDGFGIRIAASLVASIHGSLMLTAYCTLAVLLAPVIIPGFFSVISAATLYGTVSNMLPFLAGMKVLLRYLSPTEEPRDASPRNEARPSPLSSTARARQAQREQPAARPSASVFSSGRGRRLGDADPSTAAPAQSSRRATDVPWHTRLRTRLFGSSNPQPQASSEQGNSRERDRRRSYSPMAV